MMVRYASYLLAALLPLLLFRWFTPAAVGQIDFWLLWLFAMVIVALPVVYAEIALAYRSGNAPFGGMQQLTREADASVLWRSFGWVSILVALVMAVLMLSGAQQGINAALLEGGVLLDIPDFAALLGLLVIAMILSMLGNKILPVGLVLMAFAIIWGLVSGIPSWQFVMTEVSLVEWGHAVALALVSVGAGTGLYWFSQHMAYQHTQLLSQPSAGQKGGLQGQSQAQHRASKQVLPIWGLQLGAGVLALFISGMALPVMAQVLYAIGVIWAAAYLLHYATQQLTGKFGLLVSSLMVLVVAAVLTLLASAGLVLLLVLVSSMAVLLLSIFAGWQMKISHLRKSLNFRSEGLYNLWRVAIRVLVPLAMVLALVGWVSEWLSV